MIEPSPHKAATRISGWDYRYASAILAAIASSVLFGLLATVIGTASIGRIGQLFLWLAVLAGVSSTAYFLIRRSTVNDLDIGRLYFLPVLILIGATSLLETGVGGILPHQLAWGSLLLIFGFVALVKTRVPMWLIAYTSIGIILGLIERSTGGMVLDIGLSTVGLFVMWLIANALSADGGVMKLMAPVALGYWIITALAVVVYLTHIPIGSMTPSTIQMPWQGGLRSIFVSGNYTGYGFITTQGGREISFVVCAYYFVAWRYDRRVLHGSLAALAFALFLTGYGRVPLVGAMIGFGVILLTTSHGTRFWKVAVGIVIIVGLIASTGLVSQFTDLSARAEGSSSIASSTSGSTGHLSVWSQHLGLFLEQPLTGVGSNATSEQVAVADSNPILHDPDPLPPEKLRARGSRGEGGWTGLLAQRGVVNGGIILALIGLAITYCFSPFPATLQGKQDMTLIRAFTASSLIFCITDVAPFSVYTVTAYVLGQVTMIAAVRTIRSTKTPLRSE